MIQVFDDQEALSQAGAELFVRCAQEALPRGRFNVALSGGSTPKRLYELLAQSPLLDQVPWKIVHFYWGDERGIDPKDSRSNQNMTRKALLDHIPVPENQIYPLFSGQNTVEVSVKNYEKKLHDAFAGESATFDLTLLGLGDNGHTASLFPHMALSQEALTGSQYVQALEIEESASTPVKDRLTLTPTVLNQSRVIAFLVSGASKADMLKNILEVPGHEDEWPAQRIQATKGKLLWYCDKAATAKLTTANATV